MPLKLVRRNIVHVPADAIVNAANNGLLPGGGVCGAVFEAAGRGQLQAACEAIGYCETGGAVITPGFGLSASYIIHTVGPVWRGGGQGEQALLRSCYKSALALAAAHGLQSIAFPLLSAGIFGYPREQALKIAVDEINAFLADHMMDVFLVLFDAEMFRLAEKLFPESF